MKKLIFLFTIIGSLCILSRTSDAQSPEWLWATSAGGTDYDWGLSLALDASGNAYVTGSFSSPTITFGTTTLTNSGNSSSSRDDFFLVKYDANGNVLWATSAGGTDDDEGRSLALDASGNVYVTGYFFSSTITFGSYTLTNVGFSDVFLVKYDANGNVLWATSAEGITIDRSSSLALDASGNAYVTGAFSSSTITFGSYTLTNVNDFDVFLVKYDANGNVLWATSAGGTDTDESCSLALDASGNAYVTGNFSSPTITFGATTLTNSGSYDIFLVKYDANGNVQWANSATGIVWDNVFSVATDASGNAYVTGKFSSPTITFGTTTLTNSGNSSSSRDDFFLVKYDANGNVQWAKSATGIFGDYGVSVATDASGNAYVTGNFSSPTITLGTTTLTNSGGYDIFLMKYNANGNVLWATSAKGITSDLSCSLALDASGNAYVTGYFYSPTITFGSYTLTNVNDHKNDVFLAKMKSGNTGINEVYNTVSISGYPNPTSNTITIGTPSTGIITIHNPSGQQLLQREITEPTTTIDVSGWKSGVYLVKFVGEKGVSVGKFVKQ